MRKKKEIAWLIQLERKAHTQTSEFLEEGDGDKIKLRKGE